MNPVELSFTPVDNHRLANLCGALDENLKQIENAFDVSIARRGEHFSMSGEAGPTRLAAQALQRFYQLASRNVGLEEIQLGLIELSGPGTGFRQTTRWCCKHAVAICMAARRDRISTSGRSRNTTLHSALARRAPARLISPSPAPSTLSNATCVKRIVLVRPAVEAGERLGFLPGDLAQKVDPYLRPLYDALYDLMGFEKVGKLFEKGTIEIAPLAYMRGRTLNHSFIILDEAQNTTPEQMKMFLTRMGFGSKAVVTGDVTQIDLPKSQKSGLMEAARYLAKCAASRSRIFYPKTWSGIRWYSASCMPTNASITAAGNEPYRHKRRESDAAASCRISRWRFSLPFDRRLCQAATSSENGWPRRYTAMPISRCGWSAPPKAGA